MPEELEELNYLLYITSLNNGKLSGNWKYAARILISSIVRRENIEDIGFQVIIQKGIEEGFLSNESNNLILTQIGTVHLNHIVASLRFNEDVKNQVSIIRDFPEDSGRIEYIKSLEDELTDALAYADARKVDTPVERIIVNGFVGQIEGKLWTFTISSVDYQKSDFFAKDLLLKNLLPKLLKQNHFCKNKLSYDKAVFFVDNQPDQEFTNFVQQNGFYYIEKPKEIMVTELEPYLFEYLISEIIEKHLISQKLVKIGSELKFIDFSSLKMELVMAGQTSIPLKIFHGFTLKVNKIKENQFLLWIDPTYMQFYTIDKWIEANGADSSEDILGEIDSVDVLPNKKPAKLLKIDVNEVIPANIRDIWKSKYKFNLTTTKGMAKVRFEVGKDYDYPIETLSFGKKWIERNIGFLTFESPAISPPERSRETEKWFNMFLRSSFNLKLIRISFNDKLSTLKELPEIIKSAYEILPPILIFSKKDIDRRGTDTRAIFRYGGYAGNKHIYVFRILCPVAISQHDIEEFLIALKRTYDSLFGKMEIETKDIRMAYPDLIFRESPPKIEEMLIKKLSTISAPERNSLTPITIIVDPNQRGAFYYLTKSIINDIWRIPDQHLMLKTFERVQMRDLPLLRGFALQLYLKSLKPEEAPWILRYPSDSMGKTVYCGIGFSMQSKDSGLRKSIGVLAICDAQGKFIHQKHLSLSQVSSYITEEMLRKIFGFITLKANATNFDRLVIYRKGHLKPEEKMVLDNYLQGLRQTENWRGKQIDVVTVEDDIYRLFEIRNDMVVNVNSGSVVEFNETESLLCVSGHPDTGLRHGTAKLMHLKSEICESGKPIFELSREYYDRTFLNWMAPVTLSKYPPELNISQNIAEITREVDINKDFSYLQV